MLFLKVIVGKTKNIGTNTSLYKHTYVYINADICIDTHLHIHKCMHAHIVFKKLCVLLGILVP